MVESSELHGVIRAGYPVVYVDTWEEERLESLVAEAAGDRPVWRWTAAAGAI